MPTFQLNLKNLSELDCGKASLAFQHALRQCAMDIIDRPADKAKRKVVFTAELTPLVDKDTGALDLINARFVIKTQIPVRQTVALPMLPTNDGILNFESLSPADPKQSDLLGMSPPQTAGADATGVDDDGDDGIDEEPETQKI